MKKQIQENTLKLLIKETGLDEPSVEFSQRLAHQVVTSYHFRRTSAARYKKHEWVGKVIIFLLIALNGLMLVKLNPFQTQPVLCWSIGGFILAFCCVVVWIKKRTALP